MRSAAFFATLLATIFTVFSAQADLAPGFSHVPLDLTIDAVGSTAPEQTLLIGCNPKKPLDLTFATSGSTYHCQPEEPIEVFVVNAETAKKLSELESKKTGNLKPNDEAQKILKANKAIRCGKIQESTTLLTKLKITSVVAHYSIDKNADNTCVARQISTKDMHADEPASASASAARTAPIPSAVSTPSASAPPNATPASTPPQDGSATAVALLLLGITAGIIGAGVMLVKKSRSS